MQKTSLVIMAKAPIPGFVKTRLQNKLTPQQCVDLYKCFLLDIVNCVLAANFKIYLAYTPVNSLDIFRELFPSGVEFLPQEGVDLGQRMANAAANVLSLGYENCIIIGGDVPTLQPSHLLAAEKALASHSLSIGPADDGGYYLIGFSQLQKRLFNDIQWGTNLVLKETLRKAKMLGLTHHLLSMVILLPGLAPN